MRFRFQKSDRLCSDKVIDGVFSKGKELRKFPFILKFIAADKGELKIAISVPKRKVKRAVDRNRLKRQIREAYRLNNTPLKLALADKAEGLNIFLIYSGKEKEEYRFLEEKLKLILNELLSRI